VSERKASRERESEKERKRKRDRVRKRGIKEAEDTERDRKKERTQPLFHSSRVMTRNLAGKQLELKQEQSDTSETNCNA